MYLLTNIFLSKTQYFEKTGPDKICNGTRRCTSLTHSIIDHGFSIPFFSKLYLTHFSPLVPILQQEKPNFLQLRQEIQICITYTIELL